MPSDPLYDLSSETGFDEADRLLLEERMREFIEAPNLEERLDGWLALNSWFRRRAATPWSRLDFFLNAVERRPELRRRLQEALARIFNETKSVNIFAEAGLPSHRGLLVELWDRVIRRLLPAPRNDEDLGHFLARQFRTEPESESFRTIPAPLFHKLIDLLFAIDPKLLDGGLRPAFADGFRLLAVKVKAQGLSADLRLRAEGGPISASPFYRLPQAAEELVSRWAAGEEVATAAAFWRAEAAACLRMLKLIKEHLASQGVSVEIVYSMVVIEQCLARMGRMVDVMLLPPGPDRSAAIHVLLCGLMAAVRSHSSIRHLLGTNMRLLHRRIVEGSGVIGQHYVALSRKEYGGIWLAAAGGGLLTVATMAIKLKVTHLHFPLFLIGLLAGLNYAISFVLLQTFSLVLATKQPAMTAACLVGIIREEEESGRREEVARFFAQLVSSQIAAALGNIVAVAAGAVAFNFLWQLVLGHPFLSEKAAAEVFHALSPLNSGTLFFAAWTGVLLWAASLAGGWIENFAVYHRCAQALRDHPWRNRFGRERVERWAVRFEKNIAGWGTNVSLGFLLGMTPAIGAFLGLPLEVRHVTLSTGQLAVAAASMQEQWWYGGWFLRAALGIAVMFVLNLSVSFLLSLFTAARAYGLQPREIATLLAEIGRRFLRQPGDFLLPPKK